MKINFDIPWPSEDDSIHNKSKEGHDAIIKALTPSFYSYANSYKNAADLIYQHRNDYQAWEVDSLVYPMFFLYRQYLELLLKEIIKTGDEIYHTNELQSNFHHRILELWDKSDEIFKKAEIINSKVQHNMVRDIIIEFNKIDPKSFSFRYPMDKDQNENLKDLDSIDLRNLYDIMQKVGNYIEACIIDLYNYQSYMNS